MLACKCADSACVVGFVRCGCAAAAPPMRVPPEVVTTTLLVMGMLIADHYLSQTTLEVQVYRRLSGAEFRLMRK